MVSKNTVDEFVSIIQYYMDYYGLYNIDIKNLLNATTDIVEDLKKAKNGPTLKKLELISNVYGLRYFEFGNPHYPLPTLENLPETTREKIFQRKELGPPESKNYNKLGLNQAVLNALISFEDKIEFLPSDVYESLSSDLKNKLGSPTRITGLFSHELKNNVEKTGNNVKKHEVGRPEEYYKVISLENHKKEKS
ncbi:hypothetical protein [Sphingobacterium kitahiroshimense]|uniref:Uncharacterized protein n=1 Tax=Sphingobacterium kitahiroshimense TaxID=470446 RepID=A0ABV0C125_9SPHI